MVFRPMILMSVLALMSLPILAANKPKGLIKMGGQTVTLTGFVNQNGSDLFIETSDKIYQIDKVEFIKKNKVNKDSQTRQATYQIPASSIQHVVSKNRETK